MTASINRTVIARTTGNLIPSGIWSWRTSDDLAFYQDEKGRTIIESSSSKAAYIVAGGTSGDFKSLGSVSGTGIGPDDGITYTFDVEAANAIELSAILIYYDKDRKRVGDHKLEANVSQSLSCPSSASFALLAIKVKGRGRTAINQLFANVGNNSAFNDNQGVPEVAGVWEAKDVLNKMQALANRASKMLHTRGTGGEDVSPTSPEDGPIGAQMGEKYRRLTKTIVESLLSHVGTPSSPPSPTLNLKVAHFGLDFLDEDLRNRFLVVREIEPGQEIVGEFDLLLVGLDERGSAEDNAKRLSWLSKVLKSHATVGGAPSALIVPGSLENESVVAELSGLVDIAFIESSDLLERMQTRFGTQKFKQLRGLATMASKRPLLNESFTTDARLVVELPTVDGTFPGPMVEAFKKELASSDQNLILSGDGSAEGRSSLYKSVIPSVDKNAMEDGLVNLVSSVFVAVPDKVSVQGKVTLDNLIGSGKPIVTSYSEHVFNEYPGVRLVVPGGLKSALSTSSDLEWENYLAWLEKIEIQSRKSLDFVLSEILDQLELDQGRLQAEPRVLAYVPTGFTTLEEQKQVSVEFRTESSANEDESPDDFDYVAFLDPSVDYDSYYLASMIGRISEADSDFATLPGEYSEIEESPAFSAEVVRKAQRRDLTVLRSSVEGAFDFVRSPDSSLEGRGVFGEAFAAGYSVFLRESSSFAHSGEYRLSVIVPVYANGAFLLGKCVSSLLRNKRWREFKILLIDDGSPDSATISICKWLQDSFSNVSFFSFSDGGSGSASRPRNKGIEMADTELLTFLDPDNEISPGGYDALIESYDRLWREGKETDFVSGYQLKIADEVKTTGKHSGDGERIIGDARAVFFNKGRFPVVSTQAAVIRTDFMKSSGIRFVEKAAGQDTLFGWEILGAAKNPTFVDDAHLLYYAEREGSVTNYIGVRYFEKCLVREVAQVSRLRELGVLDAYIEHHFEPFMRGWYLKKLDQVQAADRWKAKLLVEEIAAAYGKTVPL